MGHMVIGKDGKGINGSNSKFPILEIKEGERISFLSDVFVTRKLPLFIIRKENDCILTIKTWPAKVGVYYSLFTVVGSDPATVNMLIEKAERYLGEEIFVFLPNFTSFWERLKYFSKWLFLGK